MHSLDFSNQAKNFLKRLDKKDLDRIIKRIENLENNPVPSDSKFIGRDNNEMIFRYRIGKFRVLYKVKKSQKIILVTKIDKRDRVYD
jgi:mRNA interferase RelE/StbE